MIQFLNTGDRSGQIYLVFNIVTDLKFNLVSIKT